MDPGCIWVDLGWIWSGSGVDLGGSGVDLKWIWVDLGWILGGSWVDWGWILGGFEVDLGDVEKYLKMCRPRILIESARFPPFGFDITEMSSNSYEKCAPTDPTRPGRKVRPKTLWVLLLNF